MRPHDDFDIRKWRHDIDMYYKWKALHDKHGHELAKAFSLKQMERIKAYWPNHSKAFE